MERESQPVSTYPVQLYAYRIGSGIDVAYHLSVCVFKKEYSYGRTAGVTVELIQSNRDQPHEVENMGSTEVSENNLDAFVNKLRVSWTKSNYNLLSHNCHIFAKKILDHLEITKPIPDEFTKIAKASSLAAGTSSTHTSGSGGSLSPLAFIKGGFQKVFGLDKNS